MNSTVGSSWMVPAFAPVGPLVTTIKADVEAGRNVPSEWCSARDHFVISLCGIKAGVPTRALLCSRRVSAGATSMPSPEFGRQAPEAAGI